MRHRVADRMLEHLSARILLAGVACVVLGACARTDNGGNGDSEEGTRAGAGQNTTPSASAECADIANAIERTLCFADRAVEAGSTSPCDEASGEGVRYQCYAVYAERVETVEPCRRIPTTSADLRDLRDVCVGDVAEVTGRAELCAEVAADGLRDSCWLSVYRQTGDRTLCDRIEDRALKSLCTDEPVRIE